MVNKYWNFQFEIDKWLAEKDLELTAASTRGLWIEILLHLKRENGNGTLRIEDRDFCRLCRCEMSDVDRFINDAKKYKFCDLDAEVSEDGNRIVTIISRRLLREHLDKEKNRLKVRRHRLNKQSNPTVTEPCNPDETAIINNQVVNNQAISNQKESPDGGHFSKKAKEYLDEINECAKKIQAMKLEKSLNIYQIIQIWANAGKPPGAIAETLKGALPYLEESNNPYGYLTSIMKTKAQNWREKEYIKHTETEKKEWLDLINKLRSINV